MWLVEACGVDGFRKAVAERMGLDDLQPAVHVTYDTEWKRRDVIGIHPQKQVTHRSPRTRPRFLSLLFVLFIAPNTHNYVADDVTPNGPPECVSPTGCSSHSMPKIHLPGNYSRPDRIASAARLSLQLTAETLLLQEGYYWACACVPSGRVTADDYLTFADIADRLQPLPDCSLLSQQALHSLSARRLVPSTTWIPCRCSPCSSRPLNPIMYCV